MAGTRRQVIIYRRGLSASRFYIKVSILEYVRGNILQRKEKRMNIFIHFHLKYKCMSYIPYRKGNVTQSHNILGYYSYKIRSSQKSYDVGMLLPYFIVRKLRLTLDYPKSQLKLEFKFNQCNSKVSSSLFL